MSRLSLCLSGLGSWGGACKLPSVWGPPCFGLFFPRASYLKILTSGPFCPVPPSPGGRVGASRGAEGRWRPEQPSLPPSPGVGARGAGTLALPWGQQGLHLKRSGEAKAGGWPVPPALAAGTLGKPPPGREPLTRQAPRVRDCCLQAGTMALPCPSGWWGQQPLHSRSLQVQPQPAGHLGL